MGSKSRRIRKSFSRLFKCFTQCMKPSQPLSPEMPVENTEKTVKAKSKVNPYESLLAVGYENASVQQYKEAIQYIEMQLRIINKSIFQLNQQISEYHNRLHAIVAKTPVAG